VSRVCLDTSAYSRFKRGDEAAVEALTRATWVGVPAVVLGELRAGFLLGAHADRNEAELARFIANPVVEVLDIDDGHFAAIARISARVLS
jgi:predicted nucleic acid-binding protein